LILHSSRNDTHIEILGKLVCISKDSDASFKEEHFSVFEFYYKRGIYTEICT